MSYPAFRDPRGNRSAELAVRPAPTSPMCSRAGRALPHRAGSVTAGFFSVWACGRSWPRFRETTGPARPRGGVGPPRDRFGDPGPIGQSPTLNDQPHTVVADAPRLRVPQGRRALDAPGAGRGGDRREPGHVVDERPGPPRAGGLTGDRPHRDERAPGRLQPRALPERGLRGGPDPGRRGDLRAHAPGPVGPARSRGAGAAHRVRERGRPAAGGGRGAEARARGPPGPGRQPGLLLRGILARRCSSPRWRRSWPCSPTSVPLPRHAVAAGRPAWMRR
jgi:hypothetical protein